MDFTLQILFLFFLLSAAMPMGQSDTDHLKDPRTEIIPTIQPPVLTDLEEVSEKSGTIEFTGSAHPHLRRKMWVFQSEGATTYPSMKFVLEENKLGDSARLSLWGSLYANEDQHVWNGSQSDWREERRSEGNVILVTLVISPGTAEQPSFKLKFTTTTVNLDSYVISSEVLFKEGTQVVSFPPNNTENYPPKSFFAAVIVSPSGKPVQLTLKYLDLPGSPPDLCENQFFVYFLDEKSTELPYRQLSPLVQRRCGKVGDISEPIGNSTVSVIWFATGRRSVGKGFRIEVKPN